MIVFALSVKVGLFIEFHIDLLNVTYKLLRIIFVDLTMIPSGEEYYCKDVSCLLCSLSRGT